MRAAGSPAAWPAVPPGLEGLSLEITQRNTIFKGLRVLTAPEKAVGEGWTSGFLVCVSRPPEPGGPE